MDCDRLRRCFVSACTLLCILAFAPKALAAPPFATPYGDRNSVPADSRAALPAQPADSQVPASGTVYSRVNIDENYALRPGDRVSFSVAEERKLPMELTVMASGEIDVPYIGRFPVAGKTCRLAESQLKSELEKKFFKRATVTLALNQAAAMTLQGTSNIRVYFTGALKVQGAKEFGADSGITVSKAILIAGGFADFANQSKVQLIRRRNDGKTQVITVNVRDILQGKPGNDPVVQGEDMIRVPEKIINF